MLAGVLCALTVMTAWAAPINGGDWFVGDYKDYGNGSVFHLDSSGALIETKGGISEPRGMDIGPDGNLYVGELNGMPGVDDAPGLGHRVSIYSPQGEMLARLGDPEEGEGPGQFIAPHGIAVDSYGDVYVGEVSFAIRGMHMDPPTELRSLTKLRKV